MPSPFPGMDPYLEARPIWPDVHNALAAEIRNELNRLLPESYYARLESRPELGILADPGGRPRRIVPDVAVTAAPARPAAAAATVLERPRREVSAAVELRAPDEAVQHHFVEVREARRDHRLVTLIEILSPSNKEPGPDRDAYASKQRELLHSDASLVEIDLLRAGRRVLPDPALAAMIDQIEPRPDYLVLVSRAWQRSAPTWGYAAYACTLRDWLPCVGIPLRREEAEVPLDLQYAFQRVYDGGPYRRGAVDYSAPPEPPLSVADAAWADGLLAGMRA